ncbi:hypothetical protein SAMN05421504_102296 [Amycolatopsis xylanica]|uniref:Uncharacterized protein n=1 Tax=Amycolatopsis xylanica TaxID=589385 RepID=A0A1H2YYA4_9PSEU|nr:hypothetical protein [Amycolatopsis xylanica]SDX09634.1 hypothetical protein SAMN05421504_102296 [Amycolatopsis xylanica]
MLWVDVLGLLSWIVAYALVVYAAERFGTSPLRHVVPFAGLGVFAVAYLGIAWQYGRWPALAVGTLLAVVTGVVIGVLGRARAGRH